ncbi:unnamed protein product [Phaeothamnion confervicola]
MDTCRTALVLANKADLPSAASAQTLVENLGLSDPRGMCGPTRGRSWYLQSCCAKTGDGLVEGMDWLAIGGAAPGEGGRLKRKIGAPCAERMSAWIDVSGSDNGVKGRKQAVLKL